MATGTATVPAASGKRKPAVSGDKVSRSHLVGRPSFDAAATWRTTKRHLRGGPGLSRFMSVQGAKVASPIAVVRRHVPAPILGLMENPAVERRPFPVTRVVQMELCSHA